MHVQLRMKDSSCLSTVSHNGKTYLVAPTEGEYEIVLTNNTNRRRMAVVAVDGMSVMDGKLAKKGDKNGYVLEPWQSYPIKGWRRSGKEVAAFAFTGNEGSYSNQIGNGTRNTGVISVAVYDEKEPAVIVNTPIVIRHYHYPNPWYNRQPYWWGDTTVIGSTSSGGSAYQGIPISTTTNSVAAANAAPAAASVNSVQEASQVDLGTAYGSRTEMRTVEVGFECASKTPEDIIVLYYGTKDRLKSRGVPVDQAAVGVEPNPFPGSSCAAPPGWGG